MNRNQQHGQMESLLCSASVECRARKIAVLTWRLKSVREVCPDAIR